MISNYSKEVNTYLKTFKFQKHWYGIQEKDIRFCGKNIYTQSTLNLLVVAIIMIFTIFFERIPIIFLILFEMSTKLRKNTMILEEYIFESILSSVLQ